mgnify:CR=1 FL=1
MQPQTTSCCIQHSCSNRDRPRKRRVYDSFKDGILKMPDLKAPMPLITEASQRAVDEEKYKLAVAFVHEQFERANKAELDLAECQRKLVLAEKNATDLRSEIESLTRYDHAPDWPTGSFMDADQHGAYFKVDEVFAVFVYASAPEVEAAKKGDA